MKLTANFNLSEFNCKDGSEIPLIYRSNVKELAEQLEALREKLGSPIFINSGYRSPHYNKKIGGVKTSQHLTGKAADIRVPGYRPRDVAQAIEQLIAQGKMKEGGIGVYPTFVHYDIRGTKARW